MGKHKKILIVMPKFPYPPTGACEQDRFAGLRLFLQMGFDVRVITKVTKNNKDMTEKIAKELGIKIFPVFYNFFGDLPLYEKIGRFLKRAVNPLYWDGASYEYRDKNIVKVFKNQISDFVPDVVWFEYTYLWPLYKFVKNKNIPVITRSINFEAIHFLEEDGISPINLLKFFSKFLGEIITARKSDFLFAITPKEEKFYKKIGARKTGVLPLRSLPRFLSFNKKVYVKDNLNIVFMGSTYNVSHNLRALKEVVFMIAPRIEKLYPHIFTFHITGAKLPKNIYQSLMPNIVYNGYVDTIDEFLSDMDIAIAPSLFGAGMQQKIFEPLARGIPTITSTRGLAGYHFVDGEHLLLADNSDDFVVALGKMRDPDLRRRVALKAKKLSEQLFAEDKYKSVITEAVRDVML